MVEWDLSCGLPLPLELPKRFMLQHSVSTQLQVTGYGSSILPLEQLHINARIFSRVPRFLELFCCHTFSFSDSLSVDLVL